MKRMTKLIASILAISAFFTMTFGVYKYLDRYALAEDMKQNIQMMKEQQQKELQGIKVRQEKEAKRLDYKILSDQFKAIQERIWTITDRFRNKKMDETTREELRSLEVSKTDTKDKLDVLQKEIK